jgi:hypothetical protein
MLLSEIMVTQCTDRALHALVADSTNSPAAVIVIKKVYA